MDSFRTWLGSEEHKKAEGVTDTGQIAHFARPVIPGYVTRQFVDPFFTERKKKRHGKDMSELPTL